MEPINNDSTRNTGKSRSSVLDALQSMLGGDVKVYSSYQDMMNARDSRDTRESDKSSESSEDDNNPLASGIVGNDEAMMKRFVEFMNNMVGSMSKNEFNDEPIDLSGFLQLEGSCACGHCRQGDTNGPQARDYAIITDVLRETLKEDGLAGIVSLAKTLRSKTTIPNYGGKIAFAVVCELINHTPTEEQAETYEGYIVEFFNIAVAQFDQFVNADSCVIVSKIARAALTRRLNRVWDAYQTFVISRFENECDLSETYYLWQRVATFDCEPRAQVIREFRIAMLERFYRAINWESLGSVHARWLKIVLSICEIGEFDTARPFLVEMYQTYPTTARTVIEELGSTITEGIATAEKQKAEAEAAEEGESTWTPRKQRAYESIRAIRPQLRGLLIDAINAEEERRIAALNSNEE